MNFNSLAFLIFLPVVTAVHWLLPHKARKYWLLAASYFFYMYWNPLLILLILFSTAVDYCCGLGMERYRERPDIRKALLLISVCMNLGLLFFFKYWDFFGGTVNSLCTMLAVPYRVPALNLILPVGISFYTFQTMSYTIDVYRDSQAVERDPVCFALFVTYFPQLVAGPIERPGDLLPQLKEEKRWSWDDFTAGARLLLCGFFRKCVVADFCGIYVNRVFGDLDTANALAIVLAGGLFCIQMYGDFAGYSEIAAGAARLMGVRLSRNFDQPYLSQSYAEFFRRWHISLGRWFTDYLYIPLGGSRRGLCRKLLNTVIVFALCGLWHGANWTYVLWGLYAAFWLCLESVLDIPHRFGPEWDCPIGRLIRRCGMFLIFIPAALLFRAGSLQEVSVIFGKLFTLPMTEAGWIENAFSTMGLTAVPLIQLILSIVTMARLWQWARFDLPGAVTAYGSGRRTAAAVYFILTIALGWLSLLSGETITDFAYFQF